MSPPTLVGLPSEPFAVTVIVEDPTSVLTDVGEAVIVVIEGSARLAAFAGGAPAAVPSTSIPSVGTLIARVNTRWRRPSCRLDERWLVFSTAATVG